MKQGLWSLKWDKDHLILLDQTKLPDEMFISTVIRIRMSSLPSRHWLSEARLPLAWRPVTHLSWLSGNAGHILTLV